MAKDRYLFISDLQIPFEAQGALRFCQSVAKEYGIEKSNVYCVGDELDEYFGGQWKKSPDATHTPNSEIAASKRKLREWYRAFPEMKLATSNHGMRWARKAAEAEIPSQMIRAYQEIIEAPRAWVWKDCWNINAAKRRIKMIHGLGYGGMYAYRTVPMDLGCSVVFGHLHANAGIAHVNTAGQRLWGMNTGCLVDVSAYAFAYGRDSRFKPWLGVGVVVDGGLTPILIPYERF